MLNQATVLKLLDPFGLRLTSQHTNQILLYLELLLRWNRRINLTAIRTEEECITRHFGETLYLSRRVKLEGKLLDIGSGAGFPGLALKIAFPGISVTLLEPAYKKRAFLKEVARACEMKCVEVRPERLKEFVARDRSTLYDTATARAVGHLEQLAPQAARCLTCSGRLCLWLSSERSRIVDNFRQFFDWLPPIALPLSRQREIWIGRRVGN